MKQPALIIALDVPDRAAMESALDSLPDTLSWVKVGLELFCAEGPSILDPLKERGLNIFLDLKLHDIPQTVANAVRTAASAGADLMTVHAIGGQAMLEAAANAARSCPHAPKLVAVTTLTSLSQDDLTQLGIGRSLADQALALGTLAIGAGIDGLVTSVHEVASLRAQFADALLVTPGIRLPGGDIGDQKRISTPSDAVRQGATHLVAGRPVLHAEDPAVAFDAFMQDMKSAL